jgi:hypothetical protein
MRVEVRADIVSDHLPALGLSVILDNTPPRHVNITGFPADKAQQKEKAIRLAEISQMVRVS